MCVLVVCMFSHGLVSVWLGTKNFQIGRYQIFCLVSVRDLKMKRFQIWSLEFQTPI